MDSSSRTTTPAARQRTNFQSQLLTVLMAVCVCVCVSFSNDMLQWQQAAGSKNYIIFKTKTMTMKASLVVAAVSLVLRSSFSILGLLLMAPKSMQNKQTDKGTDRQKRQTDKGTHSQPASQFSRTMSSRVELAWST